MTLDAGVKEFTAEDGAEPPQLPSALTDCMVTGTVVLPLAMATTLGLNEGDKINVCHATLPRATSCVLQPLQSEFFGIPDHKAAQCSLCSSLLYTRPQGSSLLYT